MTQNKFSIVLPVRNGGEYVKECINSILGQTYPHFNLLVLDNCSTDGTREWISAINDNRIEIHPASTSLSIEENWARIASVPKNEFMTCIGHDDVLEPFYLEEMNALIQAYPEASLYQAHFNFIDASGKFIRACMPVDVKQDAAAFLEKILTLGIDVNGTGFMLRSKDYEAVGGIPPFPNLIFADFALWLDVTRMSYKITSARNCFSYRLHQSMTATTSAEKFYGAFETFVSYLYALKQRDTRLDAVITNNAKHLISFYCRSFSHKLLRVPLDARVHITVQFWMNKCAEYVHLLTGNSAFSPAKVKGVRLAALIDSNFVTRQLFLAFKKFYARPVWNDH